MHQLKIHTRIIPHDIKPIFNNKSHLILFIAREIEKVPFESYNFLISRHALKKLKKKKKKKKVSHRSFIRIEGSKGRINPVSRFLGSRAFPGHLKYSRLMRVPGQGSPNFALFPASNYPRELSPFFAQPCEFRF